MTSPGRRRVGTRRTAHGGSGGRRGGPARKKPARPRGFYFSGGPHRSDAAPAGATTAALWTSASRRGRDQLVVAGMVDAFGEDAGGFLGRVEADGILGATKSRRHGASRWKSRAAVSCVSLAPVFWAATMASNRPTRAFSPRLRRAALRSGSMRARAVISFSGTRSQVWQDRAVRDKPLGRGTVVPGGDGVVRRFCQPATCSRLVRLFRHARGSGEKHDHRCAEVNV